MTAAGALRHRVEFTRKVVTLSDLGEETITWTPVATLWGLVRPLTGRELLRSQAEQTDVTVGIDIRYYAALEPATNPVIRAEWDGHTYDVRSVIPDQKKRDMALLCTEII